MIIALLLKWVLFTLIILFAAWLIPGVHINNYLTGFLVAIILALINISIKPMLNLITFPINLLTLGIFALVINAVLLMFVAQLVNGFEIDGFWSAFLASMLISILSIGLSII